MEAYDPARVSLPDEGVTPVSLSRVLGKSTLATFVLEYMLADDDVVPYRQTYEHVGMYTDTVLEKDINARCEFYKRLCKCGILGFSKRARGRISPFLVSKMNGKQRLALDCRKSNQLFRKPHRPELAPAESIQRIENTTGVLLYEAEAD